MGRHPRCIFGANGALTPASRIACRSFSASADEKLFAVNIVGVSMVIAHRSAISAEVKKSGLDGLIKVLKQKNMEVGAWRRAVARPGIGIKRGGN
jgi:hypothetical protein